MAANVHHTSPQKTTHGKRRKSVLKTERLLQNNRMVLNKLK
jgi:hypothetical protein